MKTKHGDDKAQDKGPKDKDKSGSTHPEKDKSPVQGDKR
jgi:hypothetical protein